MWTPLSILPKETGRYIVAHRGVAKIIQYLHPDGDWITTAKIGWQDDPAYFGATHYQPLEKITPEDDRKAEEHRLELLTERDVIEGQIHDLTADKVEIDWILSTVRHGDSREVAEK
jgi:hypothetical protein